MSPGPCLQQRCSARARSGIALLLALVCTVAAAPARPAAAPSARIVDVAFQTPQRAEVIVESPEMGRVELIVLLPRDRSAPRPTLYLLDGRSAFSGGTFWLRRGRAEEFFADKPVNVVLTTGGTASYYTDWDRPDPELGRYRWETLLAKELPRLIDARFRGTGANAVAGLSMGAQAAMMLATRHPRLYRGVAGFSGCYSSAGSLGEAQMRAVIASYGGNADNMFGPAGAPGWAAHDVLTHADALRGKAVYLSAGSGLPGIYETLTTPGVLNTMLIGGPLESVTGSCTRQLADRLARLAIPVTARFRPTGTHSWPYWADELPAAWPTLAGALGLTPGR